jgi:hypothetical protein
MVKIKSLNPTLMMRMSMPAFNTLVTKTTVLTFFCRHLCDMRYIVNVQDINKRFHALI